MICCLFIFMLSCSNNPKADLIVINANVHTVEPAQPKAEAFAIAAGKIIAVGSNKEIQGHADAQSKVLDLAGKTVTPGFIDSHYHLMGVGKRSFQLNLDGAKSLSDFLQKVKAEVSKKGAGEWVVGRGWIEEDWPSKKLPTCWDLDRISPKNPLVLTRADGHAIVVNSAAMQVAGIKRTTVAPKGGAILKDKHGNCNGIFLDNAMQLITAHAPSDTSFAMQIKYTLAGQKTAFSYGITQVHNMGSSWRVVDVWKKLYRERQLKLRIYNYISGPGPDADLLLKNGSQIGLFQNRLTVRGIKSYQDGALGSRGAALLERYSDANSTGLLVHSEAELLPLTMEALRKGIQMAIHAIGDAGNRSVLDIYEKALLKINLSEREVVKPRFRVEHAQILHPDDQARFKLLQIIPSMQPSHAIGDLHFAVRRLGLGRMDRAYAWRSLLDSGAIIPAGSDAPVEEGNPMIEFYAATTRKDTTGFSTKGWLPELKMTRAEALKALTIWGATAAFMEDQSGSILPGKLADFVVLDHDLMTGPQGKLYKIKVLQTYVGGELVYNSKETEQ